MKEQIFEYCWHKPQNGDVYINAQDLRHAIGNSDQFPFLPFSRPETSEVKIVNETIEAVINAIEATPKYILQDGRLIFPELPKKKYDDWDDDDGDDVEVSRE